MTAPEVWTCEAGFAESRRGTPVIRYCGKPAVLYPSAFSEIALCPEHVALRTPHTADERTT